MNTKDNIFKYIKENGPVKPGVILDNISVGEQMLYRHLKALLNEGVVEKSGSGPQTFYAVAKVGSKKSESVLSKKNNLIIEKNFYFVSPTGRELKGINGFETWCQQRGFDVRKKANEFTKVYKKYEKIRKNGLLDATDKIKRTFKSSICVDKLFYDSFYSVEIFGKTKMGQRILYAKQGQDRKVIKDIALEIRNDLERLIKKEKIQAVIFVPPTVPRKIQFMKVLERNLGLRIPKIGVSRIFGKVRVPQKTLKKIEDRIRNAESTFYVESVANFERILIIDDAVGSGASINQIACKIKKQKKVQKIIGFAITGSLNDFDVISEV